MNIYYTSITAVSCATLFILNLLVRENDRVAAHDKNQFYLTYLFIALAALCEYGAVVMNGMASGFALHAVVKSLDYSLTPVAGLFFVRQLSEKDRLQRAAVVAITGNGILSLISIFTGWYFYIDGANVYHHGPLYAVYFVIYVFIGAFALIEFLRYARRFARRNCVSIYAVWIFMTVFILLQQFVDSDMRVIYLVLSVSCVMVYAHYCQYRLQESTATINLQQDLLDRDSLTDLYSRFAYNRALEEYDRQGAAPAGLAAVSIDANGLKTVNDTLGHVAGDDLLRCAAAVIRETFGPYGRCYRTGGDEFIVILRVPEGEDALARCVSLTETLRAAAVARKGKIVSSVSLACGYAAAADHPDLSVEKLVSIADAYMYKDKEKYHSTHGSR